MAYWSSGGPLPDDDEYLSGVARLDQKAWKRIRPTLERFFEIDAGFWHHGRIDAEIAKANRISEARQNAGKRGGEAKANGLANGKQKPTPSQSPSPRKNSDPNGSVVAAEADDPAEPEEIPVEGEATPARSPPVPVDLAFENWNIAAQELGLPLAKSLTPERRRKLAARLRECGGLDGWIEALEKLENSPFCLGKNDRGWRADLDFMLQPKSFNRLREGAYTGDGGDP
jgi:uncharacterized protein YdaU (DUF1376 family)